ncbi:MAG: hypothetical protein A4E69_01700 [Syntrophus sp. PtaB.Bin138]|nr:MAG: hypothetical protein A4E69_01700 [Syntrophus sp. PtaB.Bin138]
MTSLGKKLRGIFLTGLAVTVPLGLTIYILSFLVRMMDSLLDIIPRPYQPGTLLGMHIPGLGMIVTLAVIFVCGLLTQSYLGTKLVTFGESLLDKIPVVRSIYQATKQIFEHLFINKNQSFKKVVLVEFPRKGVYSLGFVTGITGQEFSSRTGEEALHIFIPKTPNPTAGFFIMARSDDLIELDMTVEAAFTLIISGGIVTPPNRPGSRSLSKSQTRVVMADV